MEDGFAKSLVIGLVVGIVCVVVILGLLLGCALGWHRLLGVKPRDAHMDWDAESGRRMKHNSSSRTLTSPGAGHKRTSSSGSFWSSKSVFDEKKPLTASSGNKNNKWPSPTGSRTSSGRSSTIVPNSPPISPTSPRTSEMQHDAKMPRAFLR